MSARTFSWLLGFAFTLLVSGVWLMMDEPLETNVNIALDFHHRPITNNNGFIYLLGFDAPKGEDPYTIGKNRLTQYRGWVKNPTIMTAPVFKGVNSIRAPLWFDGSDEALIARAKDLPYVIAANPNLYSRYLSFLQFTEFDTLIHFDAQTTEDLSEGLILGNRFLRADVLSKALTGYASHAATLLIDDINAWRNQLQLADSISHKLLAARILTKDFSLMVMLAQKNAWSPDTLTLLINALTPLSPQQISLERPLLHAEFSKVGYALLDAPQKPEIINASQHSIWPLAVNYKPNMSVNFLYKQYAAIARENNLPPRQLFIALQQKNVLETEIPLNAWIKNSIGIAAVQNLTTIDFISYTARLWDVDVNRLLTRLVLEATQQHITTQDALSDLVQQPIYRGIWDNKPPHYSADKTHLCYDGPLDDKKMLRCVDIAWLLQKHP